MVNLSEVQTKSFSSMFSLPLPTWQYGTQTNMPQANIVYVYRPFADEETFTYMPPLPLLSFVASKVRAFS